MLNRTIVILTVGFVSCLAAAARAEMLTFLDEEHQGKGNKGSLFRPVDLMGDPAFFLLSARSVVDPTDPFNPDAAGQLGTVFVDKDGTGVQTGDAHGSKGLSGKGGHKDEELIFTFDAPILASSVLLELIKIKFADDDPVLFFSTAGTGLYDHTVLEADIQSAFTATGNDTGVIDFGMLTSLPPDLTIRSFKIRETNDHLLISGITNAVPEPASAMMMGFGAAALLLRRRRDGSDDRGMHRALGLGRGTIRRI